METIHKIGRRKTAVARIYLSEGKGNITVNDKAYDSYFTTDTLQYKVLQPLTLLRISKLMILKLKYLVEELQDRLRLSVWLSLEH